MDVANALLLDDLVVFGADASAAEGVSIRDSVGIRTRVAVCVVGGDLRSQGRAVVVLLKLGEAGIVV